MWVSVLQARCALGDTEYAIMQAQEMKDEAIRLNYTKGTFIAALALAQAYDFAGRYDEAIETYTHALKEYPTANENALLMIHGGLAKLYRKQKNIHKPSVNIKNNLMFLQVCPRDFLYQIPLKRHFWK